MRVLLKSLVKNRIVSNALSLYSANLIRHVTTLAMIPYLAHVLGVNAWGNVAYSQATSRFVAMFVEFGFIFSASRAVACQNSQLDRQQLIVSVMSVKIVVVALITIMVCIVGISSSSVIDNSYLYIGAAWGCVVGLNMHWFLIGVERLGRVSSFEVFFRILCLVLVLVCVRDTADAYVALIIYFCTAISILVYSFYEAYRETPFKLFELSKIRLGVELGWSMFLQTSAVNIFRLGGVFYLGFIVSPSEIGIYATPEKIIMALSYFSVPLVLSFIPIINQTSRHDKKRYLVSLSFGLSAIYGLSVGLLLILYSDSIVSILFGDDFSSSAQLLCIFAFIPLLVSLSTILGQHLLIPNGFQSHYLLVSLFVMFANLLAVILVVPLFGVVGMAFVLLFSEALFVSILLVIYFRGRVFGWNANAII